MAHAGEEKFYFTYESVQNLAIFGQTIYKIFINYLHTGGCVVVFIFWIDILQYIKQQQQIF